jgi:hypothetical protein
MRTVAVILLRGGAVPLGNDLSARRRAAQCQEQARDGRLQRTARRRPLSSLLTQIPAGGTKSCRPGAEGHTGVSLHHLSAAFLFFTLSVTAFSQSGRTETKGALSGAPCRVIRRLGYPFGKRVDRVREVRYALLDTCPGRREPAARPMIEVIVNGEKRLGEFDVARFFKDRRGAAVYAQQNNINDFKTELDDYSVLPQMRPVVSYFKALEVIPKPVDK